MNAVLSIRDIVRRERWARRATALALGNLAEAMECTPCGELSEDGAPCVATIGHPGACRDANGNYWETVYVVQFGVFNPESVAPSVASDPRNAPRARRGAGRPRRRET
jgi:hypothetical protein